MKSLFSYHSSTEKKKRSPSLRLASSPIALVRASGCIDVDPGATPAFRLGNGDRLKEQQMGFRPSPRQKIRQDGLKPTLRSAFIFSFPSLKTGVSHGSTRMSSSFMPAAFPPTCMPDLNGTKACGNKPFESRWPACKWQRVLFVFFCFVVCLGSCTSPKEGAKENLPFTAAHISQVLNVMTEAMLNDVTNPPLAARFFSYATLAGYEVIAQNEKGYTGMAGLLKEYPALQKQDSISGYDIKLAALLAMMETAKKLQPSGALIDSFEVFFLDSCKREGIEETVAESSLRYAKAVSKIILSYAKADRYNQISNYPRYTPQAAEGYWFPTPPGYFTPVEPYFNTVRSFTLDTCSQFQPPPPVPFSVAKGSAFYRLLQDSYQESKTLSPDHQEIAAFWDCNPFALQDNGHLLSGQKKISPGAHWLGITGIACQQAKTDFARAMKIHTVVSIGLMDGFLACWDEKFRSNRIRPETAIRKYIDPSFQPLLQTPPFPEYLSGHSVISSAAAVILSFYFGENFSYTDTVELRFGLPARRFTSFQQAAMEAGLSRFYGGIHFMDAINNGREQGLQVGEWVLSRLEKKPLLAAAK
jgi:hypothetical protein